MKSGSPGVIFQFVQHMHARAWCLYTTYVTDKNGHHPVNFTGCSVRCSILASSIRILQFYIHPRKQTCSAPFYPKEQYMIQHARVQSFFWEGGGGFRRLFFGHFSWLNLNFSNWGGGGGPDPMLPRSKSSFIHFSFDPPLFLTIKCLLTLVSLNCV